MRDGHLFFQFGSNPFEVFDYPLSPFRFYNPVVIHVVVSQRKSALSKSSFKTGMLMNLVPQGPTDFLPEPLLVVPVGDPVKSANLLCGRSVSLSQLLFCDQAFGLEPIPVTFNRLESTVFRQNYREMSKVAEFYPECGIATTENVDVCNAIFVRIEHRHLFLYREKESNPRRWGRSPLHSPLCYRGIYAPGTGIEPVHRVLETPSPALDMPGYVRVFSSSGPHWAPAPDIRGQDRIRTRIVGFAALRLAFRPLALYCPSNPSGVCVRLKRPGDTSLAEGRGIEPRTVFQAPLVFKTSCRPFSGTFRIEVQR